MTPRVNWHRAAWLVGYPLIALTIAGLILARCAGDHLPSNCARVVSVDGKPSDDSVICDEPVRRRERPKPQTDRIKEDVYGH